MWRRPAEAGRWWWPYKEFVNMIRRAAWTASRCVGPSPRIGHLTTDSTANHRPSKPAEVSGDAVASAADRRRQRQLSVDPSVILSSRPSVQPLRHRTQAAKQLAEDAL